MAELRRIEAQEIIVQGTLEQYNNFLTSTIWRDLESNYLAWIEDIRNLLEVPETTNIAHLQGCVEAVRRALVLPKLIREEIITQLGIEEEEEDGN